MEIRKIDQVILFLITLTFYGYFLRPPDWNIASRLSLVKAVVEEHRLEIDSYHDSEYATGDKALVNGHYYSDKPIGASLLGVFAYWPVYQITGQSLPRQPFTMLITALAIGLPCALLAPLLYGTSLRINRNRWMALTVSLCICLGTAIFPFAGAFYGHSPAALLAFAFFAIWLDVNQFDVPITANRILLSGFFIGYMLLTEYSALIIALVLTGYAAAVVRSKRGPWKWKALIPFAAGGLIPLILLLGYNWASYGSPLEIGYANEYLEEFQSLRTTGFLGFGWPSFETLLYMTIHPMQGIFIQSPVLLIAFVGMVVMTRFKELRLEFAVAVLAIASHFLVISGAGYWWGGDSFTVRYLIPVIPFFGFFLMYVPKKWYPLLIGLGLVSIFQMMIASATLFYFMDQMVRETLAGGFVFSWESSLMYREMFPKLMKNIMTFTWGKYLFRIDSWYFNFAIPMSIATGLLIVFWISGRAKPAAAGQMSLHPPGDPQPVK